MSALFALMRVLMAIAARVCFRRFDTLGRERFPARGAVVVVANHPATWTDAVVLDVALGRKLHFIAHEALFRPWIRGLLLRLFASLPIWYRREEPGSAARNRETFARCRAAFRAGEAIAVFPEGVSGDEHGLLPLKTGTARLLLDPESSPPPPVLPVAILYEDRTAFRTAVGVTVGEPLRVDPAAAAATAPDHEAAVRALTDRIEAALRSALATAVAHAEVAWATPTGTTRGRSFLARAPEFLVRVAGTAGFLVHAVPRIAIEGAARRLVRLPQQIAFVRMISGVFLIPIWYAMLCALAAALGGGTWFALPLAAPPLGLLACREFDRRRQASRSFPRSGGPP